MDIKEHTTPDKLEKYSFLWSEVRLLIAAVALFIGGFPPIFKLGIPYGPAALLLNVSWIISGLAAGYLLYRWMDKKMLFGGTDKKDLYAFFVMVVSGINLGLAGILGTNIGMRLLGGQIIYIVVGVLYVLSAYHLYTRFRANGQKIF